MWWNRDTQILAALRRIEGNIDQLTKQTGDIMALVTVDTADIQAVQTGIATLKTDTAKSLADIAAKLGAVPTADPATKAALQAILGDVNTLDSNIKAADPGAPLPAPAP